MGESRRNIKIPNFSLSILPIWIYSYRAIIYVCRSNVMFQFVDSLKDEIILFCEEREENK